MRNKPTSAPTLDRTTRLMLLSALRSLRDSAWVRFAAPLCSWSSRIRDRHELARLNDREIRDLGWQPAEVSREARKPFWRS